MSTFETPYHISNGLNLLKTLIEAFLSACVSLKWGNIMRPLKLLLKKNILKRCIYYEFFLKYLALTPEGPENTLTRKSSSEELKEGRNEIIIQSFTPY